MFKRIKHQLGNYSEEPDEAVWLNIAEALKEDREPKWIWWFERGSVLSAAVILLFLGLSSEQIIRDKVNQEQGISNQSKPIDSESRAKVDGNQLTGLTESKKTVEKRDVNVVSVALASKPEVLPEKQFGTQNGLQSNISTAYKEAFKIVNEDSIDSELVEQVTQNEEGVIQDVKRIIRKKNLRLSLSLTPLLAFRKIAPVSDNVIINAVETPSVFSSSRLGWQLHAGLQGNLSSRWEYQAGLTLYSQKQMLSYRVNDPENSTAKHVGGGVYEVSPGNTSRVWHYNMFNVGLQAGVFYTIKPTRLMHQVGLGASYQLGLMNASANQEYTNNQSKYLAYHLMYRLQFPVSKYVQVYLQPQFSHVVWADENLYVPFTMKVYQGGVGAGVIVLLAR